MDGQGRDVKTGAVTGSGTRTPLALCLAGGGYSGAVFELGAAAALEAALGGWSPRASSVIVGTSAGAVAGAILALGVEPEEARRAVDAGGRHPLSLGRGDFSRVPWRAHAGGWLRVVAALPGLARANADGWRVRWSEVSEEARERLPAGMFTNAGIEDLVNRTARWMGRSGRFGDLAAPLRITATDLDTGESVVYGAEDPGLEVGRAVRASSAIPLYFAPVRLAGKTLIDGQIADPLHLDAAAGAGTRAVIAVNPLVPYVRPPGGSDVVSSGPTGAMDQSARVAAAIKLRASRTRFERDHPRLGLRFVEPRPDEVMTLLRAGFSRRSVLRAWELGFRCAARTLRDPDADWAGFLESLDIRLEPEGLARAEVRWGLGGPGSERGKTGAEPD